MIGDPYIKETDYFPPLPVRTKPEWFDRLPSGYQSILSEVYQALDHSLFFLASTGTRTAVDQLIVDKIGDGVVSKMRLPNSLSARQLIADKAKCCWP